MNKAELESAMQLDISSILAICSFAKLFNIDDINQILLACKDRLLTQGFEEKDINVLIAKNKNSILMLKEEMEKEEKEEVEEELKNYMSNAEGGRV